MSDTPSSSGHVSGCMGTTGRCSLAALAQCSGYPFSVRTVRPSGPIPQADTLADFQGGAFVSTMLRCVIGKRWDNLGAQFPPSVGTTLQRFLGFLIFWAIELPFCSLRPNRLRWLYTFKAWTLPPSVFGLLIYCLVQSRGQLASDDALAGTSARPHGGALIWLVVGSINSAMGNWVCLPPISLQNLY